MEHRINVSTPAVPNTHAWAAVPAPVLPPGAPPCRHLGPDTGARVDCATCQGKTALKLLACAVHGRCVLGPQQAPGVACCGTCPQRDPRSPGPTVPFLGEPDPIDEAELSPLPPGWATLPAVRDRHIAAFRTLLARDFGAPERAEGQGVVYCGGGKLWPMIVVALRMLRDMSSLPVRVYYRGAEEPVDAADVADLSGVELIDSTALPMPYRILRGWESKTRALLDCPWERVLYLDADAYVVSDPAPLLALAVPERPFVFWMDMPGRDGDCQWSAYGLEGKTAPMPQGGQLSIHRRAFWRELCLSHWLNQRSDYTYAPPVGYGDQSQWCGVLAATGSPFHCLGRAPWIGPAFVCSVAGRPLTVHRCQGKIGLPDAPTNRTAHLPGDARAFAHLDRLLLGTGSAAEVFGRVYRHGLWGHHDRSGGGSTPHEAMPYLNLVNGLIAVAGWHHVVDLGCGDGWITQRIEAEDVVGVDCYSPHLERLQRDRPERQWLALDLVTDRERLPCGDVALLKDVLHHFPSSLILSWLAWARASGKWKWILLVNDSANAVAGADCRLGAYRPLRHDLAPLSGVPGLRVLASYLHKSVCLLRCD